MQLMTPRKRIALICTAGLGLLVAWGFWPNPNHCSSVQLPDGISFPGILHRETALQPRGWYTNKFSPFTIRQGLRHGVFTVVVRFKIQELLGRSSMGVPNPAREVDMRANLADCSSHSGETYLLARELFPEGYSDNWPSLDFNLGYVYGGSNRVRHVRDWIALNEVGLVRNGVISYRKKQPLPTAIGEALEEPFATNWCAIIRDAKGFVKVIPLDCLPAYTQAHLVRLPKTDK